MQLPRVEITAKMLMRMMNNPKNLVRLSKDWLMEFEFEFKFKLKSSSLLESY